MSAHLPSHRDIGCKCGETAFRLVYLAQYGEMRNLYLSYLQSQKSNIKNTVSGGCINDSNYRPRVDGFAKNLASSLIRTLGGQKPDAILRIPSSQEYVGPYFSAIKDRFANVLDLTGNVRRRWLIKSAVAKSCAELLDEYYIEETPDLSKVRVLVLVDEILAEGKSACVIFSKLRDIGLSSGCQKIIAAPLWVKG